MIFNKRFGPYRLVKKLATGGMAEVYLALREGPAPFAKLVALKSILPHVNNDKAFVDMFYHESLLGALFHHPNLIHVYEAGRIDGRHTMVMEFVAGQTAQDVLDRLEETGERLPLEVAVEIVSAAALGLHSAHTLTGLDGRPLKVVHRDISPHNIMVGFDGQVKAFDFGVAVASSNPEASAQLAGKAAYMSPEQCRGRRITARSDVFALGIVLHELITGQRLFKRDNQISSIRAITEEAIPSPSQSVPGLPPEIDAICMTALARSPEDRFASALELHRALHAFMFHMKDTVGEESIAGFMGEYFRNERIEIETVVKKILMAPPPSQTAVDLSAIGDGGEAAILASESGGFDDYSSPVDAALASGVAAPVAPAEERAIHEEATSALSRELDRARTMRTLFAAIAVVLLLTNVAIYLFTSATSSTTTETTPGPAVTAQVTSEPPGAEVRIDGVLQESRTPTEVSVPSNVPVRIEWALPGYVTTAREVTIEDGDTPTLAAEMQVDPDSPDAPIGSVIVSFTPEDATVTVDQRRFNDPSGRVEIDGLRLNREYVLRLQREGFETISIPFDLDSDDPLDMQLELAEAVELGRITVTSSPSGADVLVNGEEIGPTPVVDLELPANAVYTIEVTRSGFQRWRRTVQLGREYSVNADLQRVGSPSPPRQPTPARPAPATPSSDDRYEILR